MSAWWKGRRIAVTGGAGFLGSRIVQKMRSLGAEVSVPRSRQYNLVDGSAVKRMFQDLRPEILVHAAGLVGGIAANRAEPGRYFFENLMMGAHCLEEARHHDVKKFVAIGSICAYPRDTLVPFKENDLWLGYPEATNAPYGLAKKMLLVQSQAYRQQYGFNSIFLLPVNLYGPGDNFDLSRSHVIPALIRKFCDAVKEGQREVEVWGTGKSTREFLYVDDCAEAIILATERYDGPNPINIGAGFEISIQDLSELIARLSGFTGAIRWNTSMPDGQPRRLLDVSRAFELFGFKATMPLEKGLVTTIDWYRQQMPR